MPFLENVYDVLVTLGLCMWWARTAKDMKLSLPLPMVLYHYTTNSYLLFQALLFYILIIAFEQEYRCAQTKMPRHILVPADTKFCFLFDVDIRISK